MVRMDVGTMTSEIKITGIPFRFRLDEGKTKVFPGAGRIVASAISRSSKNRYKVYVLYDFDAATDHAKESIGEAVEMLQSVYDRWGSLVSSPTSGK